jgi:hypothetical protein
VRPQKANGYGCKSRYFHSFFPDPFNPLLAGGTGLLLLIGHDGSVWDERLNLIRSSDSNNFPGAGLTVKKEILNFAVVAIYVL